MLVMNGASYEATSPPPINFTFFSKAGIGTNARFFAAFRQQ
jgi:hypothetical protein